MSEIAKLIKQLKRASATVNERLDAVGDSIATVRRITERLGVHPDANTLAPEAIKELAVINDFVTKFERVFADINGQIK